MLKGQIQRQGAATAGHNGHARPAVYPRLVDFIEVYTLEGHSDFVEGARDIFQKIKEDFGVRWKGKEICSKLYLKRVIQDVLLTRSLHFIKTVRTIVCDTQSAGDQLRLNKRIRTNRSL